MVIPMRIMDAIIQRMKGVIGSAPVCELILLKTTIPMTTTAMDNPRGILIDNGISFILISFLGDSLWCMASARVAVLCQTAWSVPRETFSCAAVPFKGRNRVIAAMKHSSLEIAFKAIGMGAEG